MNVMFIRSFKSFLRTQIRSIRTGTPTGIRPAHYRRFSNMPLDKVIRLDSKETQIRDYLVGAAELYGQANGGKTPVLRFAGGWVRDKLLGGESKDIDVAIDCMSGKEFYHALQEYEQTQSSDPSQETKSLGKLGEIKKDAEKSKHLETATTKLFGLELDLVNLRTETYNEDSRNPTMEMGTAEEDAQRRDATINALFYNLNTKEVEDLTGRGLVDLENGIIRTPLDAEQTFRDDPLRILRLIRFACRFGFEIEESALRWMKDKSIQAALEKKISRERILVELEKTLKGQAPARALQIILDQELYNTIFTLPDYEQGVVPRVSTKRLENVLRPNDANTAGTITQTVLDLFSLTDVEDRWRGWIITALLPWFGQPMPSAVIKKSLPTTMAARVARDSLKIDNHTMKVVGAAEINTDAVKELIGQHGVQEGKDENSDASRKRQCVAFDRVTVGMAIRRWGEHYRCVVAASALLDLSEHGADTKAIMASYSLWLQFVEEEQLGEVWNPKAFKAVLEGQGVFNAVKKHKPDVERGPWMAVATDVVAEYQLGAKEGASAEGAEQALLKNQTLMQTVDVWTRDAQSRAQDAAAKKGKKK